MSELDERVSRIQSEYEQAVKSGEIDPDKMDIERFADAMADDIEFEIAADKGVAREVAESKRAVKDLFGTPKRRESVIKKWFGKK